MSDPIFCRRCGTKLKGESRFCTECGGGIDDDAPAVASATDPAGSIRWRVEVALITNRFVVFDTLMGCVATTMIGGVLLSAIFGFGGGLAGIRSGMLFAGAFGVFMLLVSVFTLTVIFGNRWPLEFFIGPDGVIMNNISEKAHTIHRLSWILALVTGRPLMAGPGLIAQSREVVGIPWSEVRKMRRYPDLGVIAIKGGLLENVRLYCTPANYTAVAQRVEALVRQHAPSAVIT